MEKIFFKLQLFYIYVLEQPEKFMPMLKFLTGCFVLTAILTLYFFTVLEVEKNKLNEKFIEGQRQNREVFQKNIVLNNLKKEILQLNSSKNIKQHNFRSLKDIMRWENYVEAKMFDFGVHLKKTSSIMLTKTKIGELKVVNFKFKITPGVKYIININTMLQILNVFDDNEILFDFTNISIESTDAGIRGVNININVFFNDEKRK